MDNNLQERMSDELMFNQTEEKTSSKFLQKMKKDPMWVIGGASWVLIVGYGIHRFKNRGDVKPSIYVIQLRLIAQGAVLGCLMTSLIYQMGKNFFKKRAESNLKD